MSSENNKFNDINQILDSTIEGIMLVKDGFIINANESFIKILNYDNRNDIIGNLASGCLMPFNKEKFIEFNKAQFQEITLVSKEGKKIPAIIKIKDINFNNEDLRMVSILDLTELKEKENLLIKQSRMAAMGEVLSMVAHQWRQPLHAIASTLAGIKIKMLKRNNINTIESNVEKINDYLQYMSTTIDEFKEFYKEGKQFEYVNLVDLVKKTNELFSSTYKIDSIEINIFEKELNNIHINRNQIVQVILNIINNSREALLLNNIKNPKIDIEFDETEYTQKISITDNAGGIPANIKNRIFEPYFTTKDKFNGTGLGLYMCKLIIETYNYGEIKLKDVENGSCFEIIFKM